MSTHSGKKIAVCLRPATQNAVGLWRVRATDVCALELALTLSPEPIGIAVNAPTREALHPYFGLGAGKILSVGSSSGTSSVGSRLAEVLKSCAPDLILCGAASENEAGSGTVPYLLAAALDQPVIAEATQVVLKEASAEVLQALDWGKRRAIGLGYPFVATVSAEAPRSRAYSHRRAVTGVLEGELHNAPEGGCERVRDRAIKGGRKRALSAPVESRLALLHGSAANETKRSAVRASGDEGARLLLDSLRAQQVLRSRQEVDTE